MLQLSTCQPLYGGPITLAFGMFLLLLPAAASVVVQGPTASMGLYVNSGSIYETATTTGD